MFAIRKEIFFSKGAALNSISNELGAIRDDLLSIWKAGVDAVKPEAIVKQRVKIEEGFLWIDEESLELSKVSRLIVVGGGKASAAMARALVEVLSEQSQDLPPVLGWINCPEGTARARETNGEVQGGQPEIDEPLLLTVDNQTAGPQCGVRLFESRPSGVNAPTQKSIQGTQEIVRLVREANSSDVVICLISGGGSALLVSPANGVSLEDKQNVATVVAAAGASINQLNGLRRCLSDVKGGGLARACRAGKMFSVVISDVLGDPLGTIASGPCFQDGLPDDAGALETLEQLGVAKNPRLSNVTALLTERIRTGRTAAQLTADVRHVVLANNADAVDAAGVRAVELGYQYYMHAATGDEGDVEGVAERAALASRQLMSKPGLDCWISGGEPTVQLPDSPGKGGRNQQLALSVMQRLTRVGWPGKTQDDWPEFAFVSGGSDGEDGPTDAAGAWFDCEIYACAQRQGLDRQKHLDAANAYPFFEKAGGLLVTGPTGTNVCDLRVALVRRGGRS